MLKRVIGQVCWVPWGHHLDGGQSLWWWLLWTQVINCRQSIGHFHRYSPFCFQKFHPNQNNLFPFQNPLRRAGLNRGWDCVQKPSQPAQRRTKPNRVSSFSFVFSREKMSGNQPMQSWGDFENKEKPPFKSSTWHSHPKWSHSNINIFLICRLPTR